MNFIEDLKYIIYGTVAKFCIKKKVFVKMELILMLNSGLE